MVYVSCVELWNGLCELCGLGNNTSTPPNLNYENGDLINYPLVRANMFNDHFCNVYKYVGINSTNRHTELHVLQQFISPKLVNVSKVCIPYVTIDVVETA